VREAVERGELADTTDPDLAVDLLVGPLFYRALIRQIPTDRAAVSRIVDHALSALDGSR
jgi:hypothetical protein